MTYTGMETEELIKRIHVLLTGKEPTVQDVKRTEPGVGAFAGWNVGIGYQWTAPELPETLYPLIVIGANSERSDYGRKGRDQYPVDLIMMIKAQRVNADIVGDKSITRAWANLEALLIANGKLRDKMDVAYCDGILSASVRYGVRMKQQTNDIDEYTAMATVIYHKYTQLRSER